MSIVKLAHNTRRILLYYTG